MEAGKETEQGQERSQTMKRTHSVGTKVVAMMTAVGLVGLGCAGHDPGPDDDPGAREVTVDVFTNLPDESGTRRLQQMGSDSFRLDEVPDWQRALLVDGEETYDLAGVRDGAEIVVPLNTGDTATIARRGDRLELVSFTGDDDGSGDLPRGAVSAVRLLPDQFEVFLSGSGSSEPDTIVKLSGIEDLTAESRALVLSLALDTLLVSLEDAEQGIPVLVAIAIIAAVVGSAWLAVCGGLAWECATRCQNASGFETTCANVKVTINPTSVQVGSGYSCRCLW
jgi:hypothetical protein